LVAPLTLSLTPLVASQTAQFQLDIPLTALFAASAYYQLKGNRPGRLALFGAAMVLCKLAGILLLIPLMAFALMVSASRNGLAGWKAHLRSQAPYFPPLAALALFLILRRLCTGTVLTNVPNYNQVGMTFDMGSFLGKIPHFAYAFTFFNEAYLLLPFLALALLLFWRPGRPAIPKPSADTTPAPWLCPPRISWRHFSFLALLVFVLYAIPNILRTTCTPLPRYFLSYLFFLHLGMAWAVLRFWRTWKPSGALLLLFLCTVLLFHWHPKHGNRPFLRVFRPLLQNQWVLASGRNGEETFEWVDYVYVTKRMIQRIERQYLVSSMPHGPPISSARLSTTIGYPYACSHPRAPSTMTWRRCASRCRSGSSSATAATTPGAPSMKSPCHPSRAEDARLRNLWLSRLTHSSLFS
jgi:hypothetical protein